MKGSRKNDSDSGNAGERYRCSRRNRTADIFTAVEQTGILDAVNLGNTVFLVAEENNRIIGYIGMYLAMDEGEITNVAVAPVERCHGVGGMLLTELLKIAENKGVARIVLEVRASNDSAIRLYERNGFVQCGMRKGFYEFPKEDAYVMVHGH